MNIDDNTDFTKNYKLKIYNKIKMITRNNSRQTNRTAYCSFKHICMLEN